MNKIQYPPVSIILPAYHSEITIMRCLQTMLAQDYPNFEVIVMDSSPNRKTEQIVLQSFPKVIYRHYPNRMYPHEARNRGVELSKNDLLVFTDPDIYAPENWISKLVSSYFERKGVIVGSLDCYGCRPVEMGAHFAKFDKWLPGGDIRRIDISPTANMLCHRRDFDSVGRFDEGSMLGDTTISWEFIKKGISLWFVPEAVVAHHHTTTWNELITERFNRGNEFAILRMREFQWSRFRIWKEFVVTLLPLRLIKQSWRGFLNAKHAGLASSFLRVSPIGISGISSWLLGELVCYWGSLLEPQ